MSCNFSTDKPPVASSMLVQSGWPSIEYYHYTWSSTTIKVHYQVHIYPHQRHQRDTDLQHMWNVGPIWITLKLRLTTRTSWGVNWTLNSIITQPLIQSYFIEDKYRGISWQPDISVLGLRCLICLYYGDLIICQHFVGGRHSEVLDDLSGFLCKGTIIDINSNVGYSIQLINSSRIRFPCLEGVYHERRSKH